MARDGSLYEQWYKEKQQQQKEDEHEKNVGQLIA